MGEIIQRSRAKEAVIEDFMTSHRNAKARGGEAAKAAEERLSPLVPLVEKNEADLATANAALDSIALDLEMKDEASDAEIALVADEQYNAIGRSKSVTEYGMIWGSGIAEWRNGSAVRQPVRMNILAGRIRTATHPGLVARKEEWAGRIEEAAAAQAGAAAPLDAAEILVAALSSQQRTLANHAHLALTRLKRDLKNLGMTESQIHEIIPDRPRAKIAKTQEPARTASQEKGASTPG